MNRRWVWMSRCMAFALRDSQIQGVVSCDSGNLTKPTKPSPSSPQLEHPEAERFGIRARLNRIQTAIQMPYYGHCHLACLSEGIRVRYHLQSIQVGHALASALSTLLSARCPPNRPVPVLLCCDGAQINHVAQSRVKDQLRSWSGLVT